jgi:hypothetical protein
MDVGKQLSRIFVQVQFGGQHDVRGDLRTDALRRGGVKHESPVCQHKSTLQAGHALRIRYSTSDPEKLAAYC